MKQVVNSIENVNTKEAPGFKIIIGVSFGAFGFFSGPYRERSVP